MTMQIEKLEMEEQEAKELDACKECRNRRG